MANGDDAAAAGYALVAGTDDRRNGWDMINRVSDYVARLGTELRAVDAGKAATVHTHTSAQITDATPANTPNTLVKRNSTGVIAVSDPVGDYDAVNKRYADGLTGG